RLLVRRLVDLGDRIDADDLAEDFDHEHENECCGGGDELGDRGEGAGADEVERGEQPEGQRAQAANERVILADRSRQRHPDDIGGNDRLGVRPGRERSQSQQAEQQVFRLQFRGPVAIAAEEARREPRQHHERRDADPHEDHRLHGERREDEAERPAAQPRNGKKKLARLTATASFHLSLNTAGSSSAPARNVSTIAPTPERNLIQDSSVPSTAEPMMAPKITCATVPTTISDSAVEMRSQIENSPAINARLNQSAASAHTLVMPSPRLFARWSAWTGRQQKPALRRSTPRS